ncbi:hypothetical protein Tco_0702707 [Tanacetum coccineum]|uniref:Uncharacterized protein n=1 Tax=Tanacetum coccineum TaxID=301880 RepID=A0ABQ4XXC5_9ASTR
MMAYFVTILTPDSARSCVMHCTLPTQGTRSIISTVSISPEGFLPSILLLVVIIVAMVAVILVVVVGAVVGVVIVVAIIGVVVIVTIIKAFPPKFRGFEAVMFPSMLWGSPPMKASISFSEFSTMFGHKMANSWNILIPGDPVGLFYSNRLGVCIPPGQGIIGQCTSSKCHFDFLAAGLRENTNSVRSNQQMRSFSWSRVPISIVSICAMLAALALSE